MVQSSETSKTKSRTAKDVWQRFIRHENAALAVVLLVLVAIMAGLTKGTTMSRGNWQNILVQSSTRGMATIGQAFVILTAGIDLSVSGVGLFSAILGGSLMTQELYLNIAGEPIPGALGILVMLVVGAGWGLMNGLAVSRLGMPALIVTLAMWRISWGAAFQVCGGRVYTRLPEILSFIGQRSISGVPTLVVIFIVVAVVAYIVLHHTSFGRSVFAVGGNPVSAWLAGINVRNTQLFVFVISGFLTALTSTVSTGRIMCASMRTLEGLELDTIAATVIGGVSLFGGRGSLIGVVLGILIMGVINNGMTVMGVGPAIQGIAKGAIIYAAVAIDFYRRRR
jgi:ribose/xylose/arabinose/galactoside ABC-type transport system permease subunit